MAASINDTRAISVPAAVEQTEETTEGLRLARFCELEESLVMIFGVMTVVYIVLSLLALKS